MVLESVLWENTLLENICIPSRKRLTVLLGSGRDSISWWDEDEDI